MTTRETTRLHVEPGDVLVFTGVDATVRDLLLDPKISQLPEGLTLIFLEPGQTVERLTEEGMAQVGWVRAQPPNPPGFPLPPGLHPQDRSGIPPAVFHLFSSPGNNITLERHADRVMRERGADIAQEMMCEPCEYQGVLRPARKVTGIDFTPTCEWHHTHSWDSRAPEEAQ